MKPVSIAVAAVVAATATFGLGMDSASAQSTRTVGTMVCTASQSIGLLFVSQRTFDCVLRKRNGRKERYTSTISNVGLDLGATGAETITFNVTAQNRQPDLTGVYTGGNVSGSLGAGGGSVEVTKSNESVRLEAINAQAASGLHLRLGVANMQVARATR